jgi:hypothetical protein
MNALLALLFSALLCSALLCSALPEHLLSANMSPPFFQNWLKNNKISSLQTKKTQNSLTPAFLNYPDFPNTTSSPLSLMTKNFIIFMRMDLY